MGTADSKVFEEKNSLDFLLEEKLNIETDSIGINIQADEKIGNEIGIISLVTKKKRMSKELALELDKIKNLQIKINDSNYNEKDLEKDEIGKLLLYMLSYYGIIFSRTEHVIIIEEGLRKLNILSIFEELIKNSILKNNMVPSNISMDVVFLRVFPNIKTLNAKQIKLTGFSKLKLSRIYDDNCKKIQDYFINKNEINKILNNLNETDIQKLLVLMKTYGAREPNEDWYPNIHIYPRLLDKCHLEFQKLLLSYEKRLMNKDTINELGAFCNNINNYENKIVLFCKELYNIITLWYKQTFNNNNLRDIIQLTINNTPNDRRKDIGAKDIEETIYEICNRKNEDKSIKNPLPDDILIAPERAEIIWSTSTNLIYDPESASFQLESKKFIVNYLALLHFGNKSERACNILRMFHVQCFGHEMAHGKPRFTVNVHRNSLVEEGNEGGYLADNNKNGGTFYVNDVSNYLLDTDTEIIYYLGFIHNCNIEEKSHDFSLYGIDHDYLNKILPFYSSFFGKNNPNEFYPLDSMKSNNDLLFRIDKLTPYKNMEELLTKHYKLTSLEADKILSVNHNTTMTHLTEINDNNDNDNTDGIFHFNCLDSQSYRTPEEYEKIALNIEKFLKSPYFQ